GALAELERGVVRWLSVLGDGALVQEISALVGSEVGPALDTLEKRGLVIRKGEHLTFSSWLAREVAYQTIDAEDRLRMHRQVAQQLEKGGSSVPPARIARHYQLAGESALAARFYREAGLRARSIYSNREALHFFAEALRLLPESSIEERFEIHAAREDIWRVLSLPSEQRLELEEMRKLAERSRDPRLMGIALVRLARHELDVGSGIPIDAILGEGLNAAIRAGDRATEIEALRLLGHLRRDQGDLTGALEAFERALIRAGDAPEHLAARALIIANRGSIEWRRGETDHAIRSAIESFVIFRRLGHKSHQAHALNALGVALIAKGEFEDAIACIQASVVLDRQAGDRIHVGRKVSNIGQIFAELGHTERALDYLKWALHIFEFADDAGSRADTLAALAEIMVEQVGDLEEAENLLDDASRLAKRLNDPYDLAHERIVRAELLLVQIN
ncbi:MAG: tetratricopeptide repeat protein, partial [Sandaracinaceae bacterium]|nr:tetratricopeptide repeat protein [Sandaracinaceae bacterium]